mmetsp:Transcript_23065/g.87226  ORF Transcript_23065/g.87226 Transcript_23065/m.87226 type:complete len:257 (+) Transcript_23065:521-1291(+)
MHKLVVPRRNLRWAEESDRVASQLVGRHPEHGPDSGVCEDNPRSAVCENNAAQRVRVQLLQVAAGLFLPLLHGFRLAARHALEQAALAVARRGECPSFGRADDGRLGLHPTNKRRLRTVRGRAARARVGRSSHGESAQGGKARRPTPRPGGRVDLACRGSKAARRLDGIARYSDDVFARARLGAKCGRPRRQGSFVVGVRAPGSGIGHHHWAAPTTQARPACSPGGGQAGSGTVALVVPSVPRLLRRGAFDARVTG